MPATLANPEPSLAVGQGVEVLTRSEAGEMLDGLASMDGASQLARVSRSGEPTAVLASLIDAASEMLSIVPQQAFGWAETIMGLARGFDDAASKARASRVMVRALSYLGRFEEAVSFGRQAIAEAAGEGLQVEVGRLGLAVMHALGELGRLNEAVECGRWARQAFMDAGLSDLAARADINLGIVSQKQDKPAEALAFFDRARRSMHEDMTILGPLEINRGEALLALDDFAGAERAFRASLQAFQSSGSLVTAGIAEGNLADMAARRGLLQLALHHFEQSRRMMEVNASPVHKARLRAEQAEAIGALGLPQDALVQYQSSIPELDRCGLALEAARARRGMGMALLRLDRLEEADAALSAAARAFDELGHATARAKTDLLRAELAAARGRRDEARTLALGAKNALLQRPAELVSAQHHLAVLALEDGRLDEAGAELDAAARAAEGLDLPPLLADVLTAKGQLRRQQGRRLEAVKDLTAAIEQVERVRGSIHAERFRAAFLGRRTSCYEGLVATLLDLGDDSSVERAFSVSEQAKSRVLREQVARVLEDEADRADDSSSGPNAEASEGERSLLAEQASLRGELNALYSRMGEHHDGRMSAWRDAVRSREAALDAVEARLATSQGLAVLYAPLVTVADVRRCLRADQALIAYTAVDGEVLAFAMDQASLRVARRIARLDDLEQRLQRLRFQMNRALRPGAAEGARLGRLVDDARRELGQLHESLVAPVADVMSGKRLVTFAPHGPLHAVPFHALWDGGGHVIEKHAVHVCPSAGMFVQLHGRSRNAWREVISQPLVVGVPDHVAPRIGEEASLVASALAAPADRVLIGGQATSDRVACAFQQARIVHLACHGRFAPETPMSSGLRLHDRWLTLRDLHRLKSPAELITLSGCDTGANLVWAGDELMGLLRGFFAAGASSLLATLWRVDDRITTQFMSSFYGLLPRMTEGQVLADVLRTAQLDLMRREPHPAHWAPFVLAGRE